jgi:hypothetical protein
MTPFTEELEAPLQSGGVSIRFTDLRNFKPVREPIASLYWSKGMTPFTEEVDAPLQSEGVSIRFTDLCNFKPVREPIASLYWSKGVTPVMEELEAPLQSGGVSICFTPTVVRRLNLLHGSLHLRACSGTDI